MFQTSKHLPLNLPTRGASFSASIPRYLVYLVPTNNGIKVETWTKRKQQNTYAWRPNNLKKM